MKPIAFAAAAMMALLMAGGANASVVVHTSAFIGAAVASTGFESSPCCTVPLNSTYSDGGVTITDVSDGPGQYGNSFIYTSYYNATGDRSWYAAASTGYYAITRTGGSSFDSIQFAEFSGFGAGNLLAYDLRYQGASVATGTVGGPGYPTISTFGFSGDLFDEVRVQTLESGSSFDAGASSALGIDDIRIGSAAVPEPASWALMITGFGLAGSMLRRRATLARAA